MNRQQLLENWVDAMHDGQLIKKTAEPYFNHLLFVARKAGPLTKYGYEIGLCHDLFEKTKVTAANLYHALVSFGYTEVNYIINSVQELTQQEPKLQEAARLFTISPGAQTVKYADLFYNIGWVARFEKQEIRQPYLLRKKELLHNMDKGDPGLRFETQALIDKLLKLP